ncbi:MAG: hypothetical protein GQF41_4441 [Candidatus Rifleibacterium amylolyticum]|nr:MAG: hypothetical protein GQF41_4441 [Candidatus Rifleibacterium amylolyticum]
MIQVTESILFAVDFYGEVQICCLNRIFAARVLPDYRLHFTKMNLV